VTGVGGFVLPETRVDVINVENLRHGRQKAKTILQDVRVLAIAQKTYVENGKAKVVKTVTLEVTPKQAETLALGSHEGSISLVLRNSLDKKAPVVAKRIVRRHRRRVYRPRPKPFDVEVIRRSKRESITFKTADSDDRI
ncbi:MAG TPA: Flp pilus assembly protein CpaB, partial [Desulfuromonadales bacterium]|nr:Flp pilus assembly protein CpaB [Desulfuromonadales bacterium]